MDSLDPELFERKKGLLELMSNMGKERLIAADSTRQGLKDMFGVETKGPTQEEFNLLKRPAPVGGKGGPKKKKQKTKK